MPEGKVLNEASLQNATDLFEISPTSLLFGLWDSTGPKGGLGVKFQRAIVSELVGVEIEKGAKTASRVDPLQIVKDAADIYKKKGGGWTLSVDEAKQEKGKPVLYGKKGEGKPSDINHGNVTPSMNDKEKKPLHGGVSFNYALQIAVLSLPALRRLHFPVASGNPDLHAQTTLAALGLCAATLSIAKGCDLRSRCLLVPEAPAAWEIVGADGSTTAFSLSADQACSLLGEAVAAAKAAKLPWREEPLKLEPNAGLVELVRNSRALAMKTSEEG
jgi:CRISPR-associated protein Csb1